MPVKTIKTTKSPQRKSNVAKATGRAGLLNKKVTFNWKIAAVIGVVLVAALGYLLVRLSEASSSRVFAAGSWTTSGQNMSGQVVNKNNGTQAIESVAIYNQERLSIKKDINGIYNGKTSYCIEFATAGPAKVSAWVGVNYTSRFGFNEQLAGGTNGRTTRCFDLDARDAYASKTVYFVIDAAAGQKAYFYSMREQLVATSGGTISIPAPQPNNTCSGVYGQGNQGDCVVLIQTKLKQLGYNPGSIDGIYGSQTAGAVRLFQSKAGLAQDGVVGPQTWSKLFSTSCGQPAAKC